jgi:hypothetical protein
MSDIPSWDEISLEAFLLTVLIVGVILYYLTKGGPGGPHGGY